ncbi:MAG: helix-turn-helix transcriptional regulator [Clostridia bacterium]|nr:helix-turn-helix transcriptional regulator [Clostridia bacterium]
MANFNERLKQLRLASGLTQQGLADELGISASAIGMYEQGRREPDRATLMLMSNYFGVSTDFILGTEGSCDVKDMLDNIRNQIKDAHGLMFNGKPLDVDADKLFDAMYVAASVMFEKESKENSNEAKNLKDD